MEVMSGDRERLGFRIPRGSPPTGISDSAEWPAAQRLPASLAAQRLSASLAAPLPSCPCAAGRRAV